MTLTRRTLLQASALGLAGSIAGCTGASENRQETTTPETTPAQEPDETILLGGEVSHWFGLAPAAIHGAENMTLGLEPGTVYEIT
jgi:nitrous oxide reductase